MGHGAGDDGRGDWEARKSCIYVNSAVGECGDVLADCYGEDEVVARQDHQVREILKELERSVGGWDSSKCPVVSAYLERQAGIGGEEVADGDQGDDDGEEGDEEVNDDDEEADGEEGDAEEGDAAEGDDEEGDGEEGDDEEGNESEDGGEEDEDIEENEDEEDAGEDDDESSSPILISSFT